jgi:hypothetical protein
MSPSYQLRFFVLFVLRYARFVLNCVARTRYRPCDRPQSPRYRPSNVVCYIPSVDCVGTEFERTVRCAVQTGCRAVYVSTVKRAAPHARDVCGALSINVSVIAAVQFPNKREQTCAALQQIARDMEGEAAAAAAADERIQLILGLDDHVWMSEPREFLADVVAPFENPAVGGVSVGRQVERLTAATRRPGSTSRSLLNLLGCFYLLRRNWGKFSDPCKGVDIADQPLELSAINTVDGGVTVISGRAACFRAEILTDRRFLAAFVDEYFARRIFGRWIGPLHADDDNFITRWLIAEGWKIKFQYTPHACITTSLGVDGPHKWLQQCIRWSRATIRSNLTSLTSPHVWYTYPWTTATLYIPTLCNYSVLIDPALIWLGWNAALEHHIRPPVVLVPLVLWMLVTKTAKLYLHLRAHPRDIGLLPVQFAFGYAHSFIKLYSTLTFWMLAWGSRPEVDLPHARETYRSSEGVGELRRNGAAMEKKCT